MRTLNEFKIDELNVKVEEEIWIMFIMECTSRKYELIWKVKKKLIIS